MAVSTINKHNCLIQAFQTTITVSANGTKTFSIPITIPSGYRVVGLVRCWSNNAYSFIYNSYINGSSIEGGARNIATAEISSLSVNAEVLFER